LCYDVFVWRAVFSDTAVRNLKRIPKSKRKVLIDGIRKHLSDSDPLESGRNKFRLRRASEFAEFELRIDPWRIFYRVQNEVVEIVMVGEKRGSKLFVEGEEFTL
jgi:mRNA-degrading endonuclease RelE of RelBE toxin-antitoxin system